MNATTRRIETLEPISARKVAVLAEIEAFEADCEKLTPYGDREPFTDEDARELDGLKSRARELTALCSIYNGFLLSDGSSKAAKERAHAAIYRLNT